MKGSFINRLQNNKQKVIFYFIRHGQTLWNAEKKIQGHADIPLNAKGKQESYELKALLSNITFTECFSSDLLRAYETAQIIVSDRSLKVLTDPRLRERDYGNLQGKPSDDYIHGILGIPSSVESDEEMSKRVFQFFREVTDTDPKSNILIVTHWGVLRIILSKTLNISLRDADIELKAASFLKVGILCDQWNLEDMHDIKLHL